MRLLPFDDGRIKQFLVNRFGDPAVAQQRFELLDEVKDLLGLSSPPTVSNLRFHQAAISPGCCRTAKGMDSSLRTE